MNGPDAPGRILALDRRKAAILARLKNGVGEVWAGDLAPLADTEKWRPAFESLVAGGILVKRKDQRSRRLYYGLLNRTPAGE